MNSLPSRALLLVLHISLASVLGIPATALAGDPVRCTTREDTPFKRLITECTDGTRAVSRYDAQLKRWRTDVTKPGPGEKHRQWPIPKSQER